MTIETNVRPAVLGDEPALAWLQDLARAAAVDQRGGPAWLGETPPVTDWAAAVQSSDRVVLVGTVDDVVLGLLVLDIAAVAKVATVQLAYVHADARELGLGDGMIELAMGTARARRCERFEGVALPGDRETKNLYERAGVTARKIILSTPL